MKWCDVRKTAAILAMILTTWAAPAVWAQMMTPQTIHVFKLPEFDANGVKKSEVFGERADILTNGLVKITGLKIFLYKEGEVEATLTASECTFDRKEKLAFSNGDVMIVRGQMKVTGKGFRWASENQHIEILNETRVVLQGVPVWQKKEKK
jgi:hypothetical protein